MYLCYTFANGLVLALLSLKRQFDSVRGYKIHQGISVGSSVLVFERGSMVGSSPQSNQPNAAPSREIDGGDVSSPKK